MELPEEERPTDVILNDDIELDKWYEEYNNRSKSNMKTSTDKARKGMLNEFYSVE